MESIATGKGSAIYLAGFQVILVHYTLRPGSSVQVTPRTRLEDLSGNQDTNAEVQTKLGRATVIKK